MDLNIRINLDNAAFEGRHRAHEIRYLLETISNQIEYFNQTVGVCRDTNGNTCGSWGIGEEEKG